MQQFLKYWENYVALKVEKWAKYKHMESLDYDIILNKVYINWKKFKNLNCLENIKNIEKFSTI